MVWLALICVTLLSAAGPAWPACGWYLMIPPRSDYDKSATYLQGYKILTNTTLSKWYQEGAYESAEVCETIKASRIRLEHSVYSKAADEYQRLLGTKGTFPNVLALQRFLTETNNANVDSFQAARCIASDDARLR